MNTKPCGSNWNQTGKKKKRKMTELEQSFLHATTPMLYHLNQWKTKNVNSTWEYCQVLPGDRLRAEVCLSQEVTF